MRDVSEPSDHIFIAYPSEIVSLGPGDDRVGDLVDFGRRKDESDMLRRLFKRLKKSIEGTFRKHMDLVDDVYLIFSLGRVELRFFDELADILDSGIACGINLEDIHEFLVLHRQTARTGEAGITIFLQIHAIDGLRQYAGHGCLPGSSHSVEQIGADDLSFGERIPKRSFHEFLSHKGFEVFRSVFLVEGHLQMGYRHTLHIFGKNSSAEKYYAFLPARNQPFPNTSGSYLRYFSTPIRKHSEDDPHYFLFGFVLITFSSKYEASTWIQTCSVPAKKSHCQREACSRIYFS